jgi:mRNA interferase RelE/StbE
VTKYKIEFIKTYVKELKKIPARDQKKIHKKILDLAKEPKPDGCKKFQGKKTPPLYRIRCGDYRIVYSLNEKILLILIVEIGHRKNIYDLIE